ncbi:MAG: Prophage antirepressor [Parcubacteria group bacterium GW2011_GWA2_36_10]|nr:MAG: Prophage antirepressor [Parcubacteria group bacterium GW2011_GWA2_36_10]
MTGDQSTTQIALFHKQEIRKTIHNNEWWFVIVDVIAVLTGSIQPDGYLKDMRRRDVELNKGWGQIATPLVIATTGGQQKLNCANAEGILRIIQSIPSPKAEPFKRWLARVGYERMQEIEDPELATKRTRFLYKAKGYPDAWVAKRMRGIEVRETLTDEWQKRGLKEQKEYEILTAEISKATFDMTPSQYKKYKNLKRENLRDHMDDLELIFTMLGEASTTEITKVKNAQGFPANREASKKGGRVAGDARKKLERETGKKVVSKNNFLPPKKKIKRII